MLIGRTTEVSLGSMYFWYVSSTFSSMYSMYLGLVEPTPEPRTISLYHISNIHIGYWIYGICARAELVA